MTDKLLRLGVLGSGRGSNFSAIADNCANGTLPAEVVCVISDVEDALILDSARKRNIPAIYLNPKEQVDSEIYNWALSEVLFEHEVDLVALAGFMRIVKHPLLTRFRKAVMNVHPSLLPSFPGLNAQRQALEHGVKFTGCTVHFVDQGTDTGPIITQAAVPVLEGDTEETLSARILIQEHRIYSEAIRLYAEGKLRIASNGLGRERVFVED